MTSLQTFAERAEAAYDKYMELQERISKIEANALKEFRNKGVAAHKLATASEYWLYRDLVNDRGIQYEVAMLNAAMARI